MKFHFLRAFTFIVGTVLLFNRCATINNRSYELGFSDTPDMSLLSSEERDFFNADRKKLPRETWSTWTTIEERSERDDYIQKKLHDKDEELVQEKEQEEAYSAALKKFGCEINDTFIMTSPQKSSDLTYETKNLKIVFTLTEISYDRKLVRKWRGLDQTSDELGFLLYNKSKKPIKIIWDESSIVSTNGTSDRIIHTGVKFINIDRDQPPSIIPPGAKQRHVIAQASKVSWIDREWEIKGNGFFKKHSNNKYFWCFTDS